MTHEVKERNETQSLSVVRKVGRSSTTSDLYPNTLIKELWQLIGALGVPGHFHLQRHSRRPQRGSRGNRGVRISDEITSEGKIVLSFQEEDKGSRHIYHLSPPKARGRKRDVPSVEEMHRQLKELSESRDGRGKLRLPRAKVPASTPAQAVEEPQPETTPRPSSKPIDWSDPALSAGLLDRIRRDDAGYEAGWMPLSDLLVFVAEVLEELGYEPPSRLTGRNTKSLFARMVESGQLERRNHGRHAYYRERRDQQVEHDLAAAVLKENGLLEHLDALLARAPELMAKEQQYQKLMAKLSNLEHRLHEAQATRDDLAVEIVNLVAEVESCKAELKDPTLREAAVVLKRLRKQLSKDD